MPRPAPQVTRLQANLAPSLSLDLIQFLRTNLTTLVLTTLFGLLAAYLITNSQIPRYRATATLEIQDLNENFLNREVSQVSPFAQASVVNDMQTQLRILQSGNLIGRALGGLPPEPLPAPRGMSAWVANLVGLPQKQLDATDQLIERATANLQARETRQSRIVDLSYESPDPAYAAAFANGLAQRYIEQSIEARLQISRGTSEFLEKQLADAGAKMTSSEHRLQDYARQSGLLVTSEDHRPDEERFRQIQQSLSKAQENRMMKQARLETAASAPLESLDVPLGSALRDYQTKLADLRRQRADLVTVFTPDFDGVKRLDAQIAGLETDQRRESTSILQAIKNDYDDSLRRERLLETSYQDQFSKVTEQAGIAIQYGILKRAVDTNRDLYNNLLQRTAEAKVASALRASGARVVDPARLPRLPYRPSRILNLLWGGTAGLLLGLVLSAFRGELRAHAFAAKTLAIQMGIPDLGSIPKITMADIAQLRGSESGFIRIPGRDPSAVDAAGPGMLSWTRPQSSEATCVRAILASILLSRAAAGNATPHVILVTSANAREGKTTLVSNLAALLSQMGRKVLLLDASPDRRLHHFFRIAGNGGLQDVLEIPGENAELLPYVTSQTFWNGVSLVSIGNENANALDLMYAPAMGPILLEMRRNFDVVLIDAPALDNLQDARILGKMADGTVVVYEHGEGRLQAALATADRLRADGTVVLGTVLNKARG